MDSYLFQVPKLKVFGLDAGESDRFGHTFGGPPRHKGIVPRRGKQPVHLVYCLNTADRKVGVKIPGVRWLPLYHGFVYDWCGLGYRVVSDTAIEILHMETLDIPEDFPYENYPSVFPLFPVSVCETTFDASKPGHALTFSGVFGFDWVAKKNRPKMYKFLAKKFREFNFEGGDPPDSFEELAKEFEYPFMQGRPDSK